MTQLIERAAELEAVRRAVAIAARGEAGAVVVLEGQAGIGKSALLRAAEEAARERGLLVLRAGGGQFERDLSFGAVRQLFEPVLRRASERRREELFAGPAAAARPLFEGSPAEGEPAALAHALFWLVANLCDDGPVAVAADDLHWWDRQSLRFLDYLVRRSDDVAVAVVAAVRSAEEASEPQAVRRLLTSPPVRRRELQPLSADGIATLATGQLEPGASATFLEAVFEVTRGNPLYVVEVLAAARRERAKPDDLAARRLAAMTPPGLADAARTRLEALGPQALAAARAVAVLGRHASTAMTARLAGLPEDDLARVADDLEAHGLLADARPLEFRHPVLRAAVHSDIPTGRRLLMHREAAALLAEAGARTDEVAAHLLETEPAGDPEVARVLRAAAAHSAPDHALALLQRALAEPPAPQDHAGILIDVGELETRTFDLGAVERLEQARRLSTDAETQRRAVLALTRAWTLDDRPGLVVELVDRELAGLGEGGDEELRHALLALRVIRGSVDRPRALALRDSARAGDSAAARYLLAALAYKAFTWGTAADARTLAEEAIGRGMVDEGPRATGFILAMVALEQVGARRRSIEHARTVMRVAREAGDLTGYVLALCVHADVVAHSSVAASEAEIEDALELALEHGLDWMEPALVARFVEVAIERGRLDAADEMVTRHAPPGWQVANSRAAQLLTSRARLRLAQGRHEDALADARRVGELGRTFTIDHPSMLAWRGVAARALAALGREEEAREVADEELAMARAFGSPEIVGRVLQSWAATREQAEALDAIAESVAILQDTEGLVPLARAHVEHGSLLRRAGQRKRAKEQLAAGLDLAGRLGMTVLAERATVQLRALGSRPRRAARTGPDALTPGERRVAELAAEGLSNRDIAQQLFVSPRTVGNQLQRAYAKLGIRSRQELVDALADEASA